MKRIEKNGTEYIIKEDEGIVVAKRYLPRFWHRNENLHYPYWLDRLLSNANYTYNELKNDRDISAVARLSHDDEWDENRGIGCATSKLDAKIHAKKIREYRTLERIFQEAADRMHERASHHLEKWIAINEDYDRYYRGKVE